jgi:hypothetical protein
MERERQAMAAEANRGKESSFERASLAERTRGGKRWDVESPPA